MILLALETSCDDTCAAVTEDERILSNVISSQAAAHERYGGVVPEVASRHHLELVNPVVDAALGKAGLELADVDALAVTRGPGLIGALLVGVATAKALAAPLRKPLVGVDHLHGHVAANFLAPEPLKPPFLCLIASGGHTLLAGVTSYDGYEVLGQTLDDAAGEALDKGARLLGLGYPGGPAIEREARTGDPAAFEFPVAMRRDPGLDFSFSGLKTALLYAIRDLERASDGERARGRSRRPSGTGATGLERASDGERARGRSRRPSGTGATGLEPAEVERRRADLAASYQAAVIDQLIAKLRRGLARGEWESVALGGGVAANALLRDRATALCEDAGVRLKLVPGELCTDNAAMIASAARFLDPAPYPEYLAWTAAA